MLREAKIEKVHIFVVMFFMGMVMSIQSPLFTPYAVSLGASSMLVGIMLGASQMANLAGNLIAGPLVDRFGKRLFISAPLFVSAVLFFCHGMVADTASLLVLRVINGFSLAFLIPAALALLSGYAANSAQQGRNMAVYGILATIASILSPLIGGKLGALFGIANTYFFIGTALLLTAFYSAFFLRERQAPVKRSSGDDAFGFLQLLARPQLQVVFLTGFAVMYIHGVIVYEVPYLAVEQGFSTADTGKLFSFFAIGTFLSLMLFFINRYDPAKRLIFGIGGMCLCLFGILSAVASLSVLLFLIGFFFGILMPAMATALTDTVPAAGHGRAFGVMSAVYSLGMIFSSLVTGAVRDVISPYFIALLVGMAVLTIIGYMRLIPADNALTKVY